MDKLDNEFPNISNKVVSVISTNETGISIFINEPEQVLTVNQIALMLDISAEKVYKLCDDKAIPHSQPFGNRKYFLRSDILEWIKKYNVPCKNI